MGPAGFVQRSAPVTVLRTLGYRARTVLPKRSRPPARVVARAPALVPARNAVTRRSGSTAQEACRDAETVNP
jgi:hypothetical protein